MSLGLFADRAGAALFALAAAALLAGLSARAARIGWVALLALGTAYDVALNLQPVNFPNSNFIHYYLGAKYPAPYLETYRLIQAGLGRPQIGMRDLAQPDRIVRESPTEQRAYLIDLLRGAGVSFDPLAPLDSLQRRARDSGAIAGEAERILAAHLPAERTAEFRADVRVALAAGQGPHVPLDYGYNGSPFYGLIRRADPALHRPFASGAAFAGLFAQLAGVVLVAFLAGAALGLTAAERIAVAALLVIHPGFANYAMPGLVFTELWVPLLIAAWALRRGWPALAGAAIAVAGLVKLFPFALALVALVPLLRPSDPARADLGPSDLRRARSRAATLLASCAATTLALGWLALASGRTWTDFLHKIAIEFRSETSLINSVSAAAALTTLGVPAGSPLFTLLPLAALAPLIALFVPSEAGADDETAARRALVLVAALGWLFQGWLDYYAIAPAFLLPGLARKSPGAAAAIAAGMSVAYLMPSFADPALPQQPALHLLKLVPYLAAPVALVGLELSRERWGSRTVRGAALALVLLVAGTGVEVWRGSALRRLAAQGAAALARSDAAAALVIYDRIGWLSPGEPQALHKRAVALAMLGRLEDATSGLERVVRLAPGDAAARDDYGRALLLAGDARAAGAQLEAASALAPADVQILFQLARARSAAGNTDGARAALTRARELAPDEPAIAEALARLGAR